MQSRMPNPVAILPDALKAMHALGAAADAGVPAKTRELIHLRASQINGCGVCVDMHPRIAKKAGETDERLFAVAAWRETPYFTEAERAALALTEAVTRLADKPDPVPDEIWNEAAKQFNEDDSPSSCSRSPPSTSGIASTSRSARRSACGSRNATLMVRRRVSAVSNHEAPIVVSSFETRRRRRTSGQGVRPDAVKLVQRFLGSNHVRLARRACRTMCG